MLITVLVPGAAAADGAEQDLAEKYAPIVGLKQHEPCASTGEPYRPVPVETVLGQSDVVLLGPDGKVVKNAPTAADLYGKDGDYWLDFPGDPLDAGCTYEQWFDRIAAGKATTAYAHVVGEQGKLALQYWFYYPFNEWNNKHESDWEMIQLVFEAATAEEALDLTPALVGYSQHEGAESAAWDDDKLEKRDGHPVVYPGAGSHANQFVQSLYLGHSAQTGFGCDDTRGPTRYEQTHVVLLPSEATGPTIPSPGSATSGTGGSRSPGRTAGRPAPRSRASGPSRSPGPTRSGGPTTSRSRPRARSLLPRPASSARPSRRGLRSTSASCATRSWCSGSWRRLRCSASGSRAERTGHPPSPLRSGSAATSARSTVPGSACTAAGGRSSSESA